MPALRLLTPERRIAAFLDAQGESRQAIGDAVGVNQATVSRWRGEVMYQAEVERWSAHELELIERMVTRIHSEVAYAGIEALAILREALHAEDKNGSPLWGTRLNAAREILAKGGVRVGGEETTHAGVTTAAAAAVMLVVRKDGDKMVIEGEATEG